MKNELVIRRLGGQTTVEDARAWQTLRLEMLLDTPQAFGMSHEEESARTPSEIEDRVSNKWSAPDNAVFGGFVDEKLVGAIGLYRKEQLKQRHKLGIWGMYVTKAHRGRGFGRMLILEVLRVARTLENAGFVELGVESSNESAKSLYESLGFRRWGTEPAALYVNGKYFDEDFMSLKLEKEKGDPSQFL